MDLLNNIWAFVNTPNEIFLNVILIMLNVLVEIPLTFHLIITIFKLNYTLKQKLIFIVIFSLSSLLSMFIIPSPFNIILNYLVGLLLTFFVLKLSILKTIIASILPSIVFNIIGNLLLNPYLTILGITYEQAMTIPFYRVIFATLMYFIVFIFVLILKYRGITFKVLEDLDKKNKSTIILNFLFGFFYIMVQCVLTVNYINILPIAFSFFNVLCLIIYFAFSFYTLAKVITLVNTTQKLESAEAYNKTLHVLHDNVRGFKHDFDNIVTTIGGYVKTNDIDGLESYYSQLQEDCEKVNNLYILNPDIINNPGIYNLITTKYGEAEVKGIKVNLTFLLDLNELKIKIYEFARILGILLDNAIESASECDKKVLNIVFRNDDKNHRHIVLIENTYKDKDINLEQIFDKGISGKEDHTGLGLWEVKQLLNKNNNVNIYTKKDDEYFSQQLEIYY